MPKLKCAKCAALNDEGATRCSNCNAELPRISFEAGAKKAPVRSAAPQAGPQFRRGQVVNNRYTVLDMIGRGGMGCIYKVHDNVLGEDLALKSLLPQFVSQKTIIDRFLNEARITRKLAHPNIVRVHDIGTAGNSIFISMEYVQGDSLRAVLEKQGRDRRIPVRQALHIIDQLCVALEYAHQYTIHRDIKPENIMVSENNQIKLMDFGISKLMDNRFVTSASVVMGTPFYMSPEQHRNTRDVDARADIYSVGIVLYEMLTGNMPTGVPKPASQLLNEIPPALDEIVARCIDPDREKRFKSASELRDAILPIIEMLDEGKDPRKTLARRRLPHGADRSLPRHLLLRGVLALIVVAAGAFSLYALEKRHGAESVAGVLDTGVWLQQEASRDEQLEHFAALLRNAIDDAERLSERQRQWRDRGVNLLEDGHDAVQNGSVDVTGLLENGVQHLMAVLMNPQDMVFVPAGYVEVDGDVGFESGFFIDATEATISQFAAFCREVEGGWPLAPELGNLVNGYPAHPVSYVSWFDAQAYAAWKGKQLPTRRQWERAAHGDGDAPAVYPWGTDWAAEAANVQTGYSMPVKSFDTDLTWSGCYDMAGNAAEWTATGVLDTAAPGEDKPGFGDLMYVCGGSFLRGRPLNAPDKQYFESRLPDLGFRCVLPVPVTQATVAALLSSFS